MAASLECPECRARVGADAFQCGHCGLQLRPELTSGEHVVPESAMARVGMAPTLRTRTQELLRPQAAGASAHDRATARFSVFMDANTVPNVRAGVDLGQCALQPFEAHVASFIDGAQSVPELARAARLPEIEVKVVLKALLERGVVELRRVSGAPAPRSRTDDVPVLDGWEFLESEPVALGDDPTG